MQRLKKIGFLAIATSLFSTGFTATQGTLGPTSTGTVNISLTIPQLVKISGLSDIALGTISGAPVSGNTTACIYSNNSGNYAVTVTGSGAGGAFTIAGPSPATTSTIAYTADWIANSITAPLTAGTKLTGRTGANTTSVNCAGGSNATFSVTFSEAAITAVPSGAYSGTATILISPT